MAPVEFLKTKEAATLLGISESTLRHWRQTGQGPSALKMGGLVRYERAAINAWIDSCRETGDAA